MRAESTGEYQIYCDRHDGQGLSLDGCWGSENAHSEFETEGLEGLHFLAKQYPDCDWVLVDPDGCEIKRIVASEWIHDDSDVIDVIDSAKAEWSEAHPECDIPTSEDTDEAINKALGLPPSGALRPLADEFAGCSIEEIRSAVLAGMDRWYKAELSEMEAE